MSLASNSGGSLALDYDAFSLVIRHQGKLCNDAKKNLKTFLLQFGTQITKISLPFQAIGATKQNSLFGCQINHKGLQHLSEFYNQSEVIVIETPIKMAIHKSCKESLVEFFKFMEASNNHNICFDPTIASNKPYYESLVDAIIESCYVEEKNESFLHIADIGMKIKILPDSLGPLDSLFTSIENLRKQQAFNVEVLQLDIAITEDHPAGYFLQINRNRSNNASDDLPSFLSQHSGQTYPIHSIRSISSQEKELTNSGSVKISHRNWKKGEFANLNLTSENCEELDASFILEQYTVSSEVDNETYIECHHHLSVNRNNVENVKSYSSIAHALLQDRKGVKDALDPVSMSYLEKKTISQLQALGNAIMKSYKRGSKIARNQGLGHRTEVSVRPELNDSLRHKGHLNDFLVYIYLSLYDMFRGCHRVQCKELAVTDVTAKLHHLCNQWRNQLCYRGSSKYHDIIKGTNMYVWLKAHLYLILLTAGYAPSYGLKFLSKWLQNGNNAADPFNQKHCVLNNNFIYQTPSQLTISLQVEDPTQPSSDDFQKISDLFKEFNLSTDGINIILEYCKDCISPAASKKIYLQLKLSDKLKFLQNFLAIVNRFTSDDIEGEENEEHITTNQPESISNIPPYEPQTATNDTLSNWEHIFINKNNSNDNNSRYSTITNPNNSIIQTITDIAMIADCGYDTSVRLYQLAAFILKCHEEKIILPGRNIVLQSLDNSKKSQGVKILLLRPQKNYTYKELRNICSELGVKVSGINKTKDTFYSALCAHYHFPTQGVEYVLIAENIEENENTKIMNKLINTLTTEDIVISSNTFDSQNHNSFYRLLDGKHITIMKLDALVSPSPPKLSVQNIKISNDGYKIISHILKRNISLIRKNICHYFSRENSLIGMFISSKGQTKEEFRGHHSLHQLEKENDFQINDNNKDVDFPTTMRTVKFMPDIIFPIICVIYHVEITFYNEVTNTGTLYVYDQVNQLCIIYEMNNLTFTPKHKTIIVTYNGKEYIQCNLEENQGASNKNTHTYSMFSFMNNETNKNEMAKLGLKDLIKVRTLSEHPWNTHCSAKKKLVQSLQSVLENLNHPLSPANDINDPLGLTLIMKSFNAHEEKEPWRNFMENVFDKTVLNNCSELNNATRTELIEIIKTFQDQDLTANTTNREMLCNFICPFFVLKFKISVIIWEQASTNKTTHFFMFNPFEENIYYKKKKGFYYSKSESHVIYLRYTTKVEYSYYHPPANHPLKCQHKSLNKLGYAKSFASDELMVKVMTKMNNEGYMIYMGADAFDGKHPLTGRKKTHIIALHYCCSSIGYSSWALILIFQKQQEDKHFTICSVSETSVYQSVSSSKNNILDQLCNEDTHIKLDYQTEHIDLPYQYGQTGFRALFYMYLANKSFSIHDFKQCMEQNKSTPINNMVKWSINYIMNSDDTISQINLLH